MKQRGLRVIVVLLAALSTGEGCGRYRPARFADCDPVTVVHDDAPIAVPGARSYDEREHISEIYLRRPLFDVVHPTDFPTGGDVNALDEIPSSSWYDPRLAPAGAPGATPPKLPLTALNETPATREDALVVHDARGLRYELLADPRAQPGLRTGADVLGGHLLRGLGLHAPTAFIVELAKGALVADGVAAVDRVRAWTEAMGAGAEDIVRVSATQWPNGIDVGVASDYSLRSDNPNDTVDHHDRRTLRAIRVFAHWIAWHDFGVRRTRDVYVGKPGHGHLVHHLVGVSAAFGTTDVRTRTVREELGGGFWWNLVTLGLSPTTLAPPQPATFPSLGFFPPQLTAGSFDVSPPYSPFVRFTPPDEYWAVKRLIDMGDKPLLAGIAAAGFPAGAAKTLLEVLQSRRRALVAHGLRVVSPLDVAATVGRSVWLRDRAISAGFATPTGTEYEIEFLDDDGEALAPAIRRNAESALTEVVIPAAIRGTVALHVRVVRSGVKAPRACDVHLVTSATSARLVGVRH